MDRWHDLQPHLRQMLGEEEYGTWIAPLEVVERSDDSLTLTTDNAIVGDWVRDHLLRDIETVARSHFGAEFRILISRDRGSDRGGTATTTNNAATASNRPNENFIARDGDAYCFVFSSV